MVESTEQDYDVPKDGRSMDFENFNPQEESHLKKAMKYFEDYSKLKFKTCLQYFELLEHFSELTNMFKTFISLNIPDIPYFKVFKEGERSYVDSIE